MEEFFKKDEVLCFPSRGSNKMDFQPFPCRKVRDTGFEGGDYGEGDGHCVCCYEEEHGDSFHGFAHVCWDAVDEIGIEA